MSAKIICRGNDKICLGIIKRCRFLSFGWPNIGRKRAVNPQVKEQFSFDWFDVLWKVCIFVVHHSVQLKIKIL